MSIDVYVNLLGSIKICLEKYSVECRGCPGLGVHMRGWNLSSIIYRLNCGPHLHLPGPPFPIYSE